MENMTSTTEGDVNNNTNGNAIVHDLLGDDNANNTANNTANNNNMINVSNMSNEVTMTEGFEPSPLPTTMGSAMDGNDNNAAIQNNNNSNNNDVNNNRNTMIHNSGVNTVHHVNTHSHTDNDDDDDNDDDGHHHSLPSTLADNDMYLDLKRRSNYKKKMSMSNILLMVLLGICSLLASLTIVSRYPMLPMVAMSGNSKDNGNNLDVTSSGQSIKSTQSKKGGMDSTDPSHQPIKGGPSLVWLFGYPQSGAVYYLHLLHTISKRATATNYGHMVMDPKGVVHASQNKDSVRVYGDNGPALFTGDSLPPPDRHILTWTATDGACRNCHPRQYMYNAKRFREYCWHGTVTQHQKQIQIEYDPKHVVAAVHLSRYPFDNIVLRFWAEREDMAATGHDHWIQKYPPSADGFRDWCHDRDDEWYDVEKAWYGEDTMRLAMGTSSSDTPDNNNNNNNNNKVMCRQEFYKYVMYHNNVVRMREGFNLPTMNLKYEDLYTGYYKTIGKLVSFLELPVLSPAPNKDLQVAFSKHYFTDEQREATFRFMEHLAVPKVATMLQEYRDLGF